MGLARLSRTFARVFAPAGATGSVCRRLLHAVGLACALASTLQASTVRAWDSERLAVAARRHGSQAVSSLHALQEAVAGTQSRDETAQVALINSFYNQRVVFRTDQDNWGLVDYWTSPLELLQRGYGDCEDYAIAKYFTLASLGVPSDRLRLVYVRATLGPPIDAVQAHMVLAYYPPGSGEPLVLDNLVGDLRVASKRPDLVPVFSFNASGLWQGVGSEPVLGDSTSRLSRWRDVQLRSINEGFR